MSLLGGGKKITRWLRAAPLDDVRAEVRRLADAATRAKVKQQILTLVGMTGVPTNDPFVSRLTSSIDDWLELLARVGRAEVVWGVLKGLQ